MANIEEVEKKIKEYQSIVKRYESAKYHYANESQHLEELLKRYELFKSTKYMTNHGYEELPKEAEYSFEIHMAVGAGEIAGTNITPRTTDKDDEKIYNLFNEIWLERIETQKRIVESKKKKLEEEAEKISLE